jgi:hypothetical protein
VPAKFNIGHRPYCIILQCNHLRSSSCMPWGWPCVAETCRWLSGDLTNGWWSCIEDCIVRVYTHHVMVMQNHFQHCSELLHASYYSCWESRIKYVPFPSVPPSFQLVVPIEHVKLCTFWCEGVYVCTYIKQTLALKIKILLNGRVVYPSVGWLNTTINAKKGLIEHKS